MPWNDEMFSSQVTTSLGKKLILPTFLLDVGIWGGHLCLMMNHYRISQVSTDSSGSQYKSVTLFSWFPLSLCWCMKGFSGKQSLPQESKRQITSNSINIFSKHSFPSENADMNILECFGNVFQCCSGMLLSLTNKCIHKIEEFARNSCLTKLGHGIGILNSSLGFET